MDKQDNPDTLNVHPFHSNGKNVPQWAFKLNSTPASNGNLAFKNIVC